MGRLYYNVLAFIYFPLAAALSASLNHGYVEYTQIFLFIICLMFSQLSYWKACKGTVLQLPE